MEIFFQQTQLATQRQVVYAQSDLLDVQQIAKPELPIIVNQNQIHVETEHLIQEKHVMQITCANTVNDIQRRLSESFPVLDFKTPGQGLIRVEADEPVRVGPLVRFLEDHGAEVTETRRMRPSLEDIFVRITGIEADAMRKEKEKAGGG